MTPSCLSLIPEDGALGFITSMRVTVPDKMVAPEFGSRLLDPKNESVTLRTIARAAKALGKRLSLELA